MIDFLALSLPELQIWKNIEGIIYRLEYLENNYVERQELRELERKLRATEINLEATNRIIAILDGYLKETYDIVKVVEHNEESNHAAVTIDLIELEQEIKKTKTKLWKAINSTKSRIDHIEKEMPEVTLAFGKLKLY